MPAYSLQSAVYEEVIANRFTLQTSVSATPCMHDNYGKLTYLDPADMQH